MKVWKYKTRFVTDIICIKNRTVALFSLIDKMKHLTNYLFLPIVPSQVQEDPHGF